MRHIFSFIDPLAFARFMVADAAETLVAKSFDTVKPTQVRNFFPETWIWNMSEIGLVYFIAQ